MSFIRFATEIKVRKRKERRFSSPSCPSQSICHIDVLLARLWNELLDQEKKGNGDFFVDSLRSTKPFKRIVAKDPSLEFPRISYAGPDVNASGEYLGRPKSTGVLDIVVAFHMCICECFLRARRIRIAKWNGECNVWRKSVVIADRTDLHKHSMINLHHRQRVMWQRHREALLYEGRRRTFDRWELSSLDVTSKHRHYVQRGPVELFSWSFESTVEYWYPLEPLQREYDRETKWRESLWSRWSPPSPELTTDRCISTRDSSDCLCRLYSEWAYWWDPKKARWKIRGEQPRNKDVAMRKEGCFKCSIGWVKKEKAWEIHHSSKSPRVDSHLHHFRSLISMRPERERQNFDDRPRVFTNECKHNAWSVAKTRDSWNSSSTSGWFSSRTKVDEATESPLLLRDRM